MLAPDLPTHITLARDQKARRFARAIWDSWLARQSDRLEELALLEKASVAWWRQLADRIGQNEPSPETRALIVSKLREAIERGMP